MSVARGFFGGTYRRPQSLLDACLVWDRCQGGTIHQYLPRLRWVFCGVENGEKVWHLYLDHRVIGTYFGNKSNLPKIDASLQTYYLDSVIENPEKWYE